jgi:hypothetical protein
MEISVQIIPHSHSRSRYDYADCDGGTGVLVTKRTKDAEMRIDEIKCYSVVKEKKRQSSQSARAWGRYKGMRLDARWSEWVSWAWLVRIAEAEEDYSIGIQEYTQYGAVGAFLSRCAAKQSAMHILTL